MYSKIIMSPGVGANSPGISLNFPHSSIFKPKCILLQLTTFSILSQLIIRRFITSDMSAKNIMTVMDVLKTIADDKSLVLFNTIALSNSDIDNCLSALELTRKQYYLRLSALLKTGLDIGNIICNI